MGRRQGRLWPGAATTVRSPQTVPPALPGGEARALLGATRKQEQKQKPRLRGPARIVTGFSPGDKGLQDALLCPSARTASGRLCVGRHSDIKASVVGSGRLVLPLSEGPVHWHIL